MGQLEALLKPCKDLVTSMLEKEGAFAVFGYGLRPDGTGRGFMSDDGNIEGLINAITTTFRSGEFEWIVFVDGVLILHEDCSAGKAIAYYVGGPCGLNKRILVPYELAGGHVSYSASEVLAFEPEPWPARQLIARASAANVA